MTKSVRKQRMEEILNEMQEDRGYHPINLLILTQQTLGFTRSACITYIEDMKRMGLLFYDGKHIWKNKPVNQQKLF